MKIKPYPETHMQGVITLDSTLPSDGMRGDLGIQIADDGRIWICINRQSYLRFKPLSETVTVVEKTPKKKNPRTVHLKHLSTIKNADGVVEIEVIVINLTEQTGKRYTYYLSSEFAVREFHTMYKRGKGCHGKALSILNQFKIKPPVEVPARQL